MRRAGRLPALKTETDQIVKPQPDDSGSIETDGYQPLPYAALGLIS